MKRILSNTLIVLVVFFTNFSEILAAPVQLTTLRIMPMLVQPGGSFSVFVPGAADLTLDVQWQKDNEEIQTASRWITLDELGHAEVSLPHDFPEGTYTIVGLRNTNDSSRLYIPVHAEVKVDRSTPLCQPQVTYDYSSDPPPLVKVQIETGILLAVHFLCEYNVSPINFPILSDDAASGQLPILTATLVSTGTGTMTIFTQSPRWTSNTFEDNLKVIVYAYFGFVQVRGRGLGLTKTGFDNAFTWMKSASADFLAARAIDSAGYQSFSAVLKYALVVLKAFQQGLTGSDFFTNRSAASLLWVQALVSEAVIPDPDPPLLRVKNQTIPGKPGFDAEEEWTLELSNAEPMQEVWLRLWRNGDPQGVFLSGNTNSNGQLILSGRFDESATGNWHLQALVGNQESQQRTSIIRVRVGIGTPLRETALDQLIRYWIGPQSFEDVFGIEEQAFRDWFEQYLLETKQPAATSSTLGLKLIGFILPGQDSRMVPADYMGYILRVTGANLNADRLVSVDSNGAFIPWGLSNVLVGTTFPEPYIVLNLGKQVPSGDYRITARFSSGREASLTLRHEFKTRVQPVVNRMDPGYVTTDQNGTTIIVNGDNFQVDSKVLVNGIPRPTGYISSKKLLTDFTGSEFAVPGKKIISALNPGSQDSISEPKLLTINPF